MSDPITGGLIAGGVAGGLNLLGTGISNIANWFSTKNSNRLNEKLTREAWARDDTAAQRRVADLKAAGLSPTLAAGSPAGVSAPIKNVPPQMEAMRAGEGVQQAVENYLNASSMQATIDHTKMQNRLLKVQMDGLKIDNKWKDEQYRTQMKEMMARTGASSIRTQMDSHDYDIAHRWGVPTHNAGLVGQIVPLLNYLENNPDANQQIINLMKSIVPDLPRNAQEIMPAVGNYLKDMALSSPPVVGANKLWQMFKDWRASKNISPRGRGGRM